MDDGLTATLNIVDYEMSMAGLPLPRRTAFELFRMQVDSQLLAMKKHLFEKHPLAKRHEKRHQ